MNPYSPYGQPRQILQPCRCTGYKFWYAGPHERPICECGHLMTDHLDQRLSCLENSYVLEDVN